MHPYLPLFLYVLIALVLPLIMSGLASLFGRRVAEPQKYDPYESGYATVPLQGRFPVKYYLVAMLFVVFDVEAASFYPWAVNLRSLGAYGLMEMVTFIIVLGIGYAYVWKKEGFTWK